MPEPGHMTYDVMMSVKGNGLRGADSHYRFTSNGFSCHPSPDVTNVSQAEFQTTEPKSFDVLSTVRLMTCNKSCTGTSCETIVTSTYLLYSSEGDKTFGRTLMPFEVNSQRKRLIYNRLKLKMYTFIIETILSIFTMRHHSH